MNFVPVSSVDGGIMSVDSPLFTIPQPSENLTSVTLPGDVVQPTCFASLSRIPCDDNGQLQTTPAMKGIQVGAEGDPLSPFTLINQPPMTPPTVLNTPPAVLSTDEEIIQSLGSGVRPGVEAGLFFESRPDSSFKIIFFLSRLYLCARFFLAQVFFKAKHF